MKKLMMIVAAMGIVALLSAEAAEAVLDRMCEGVPRYWQVAFTNEAKNVRSSSRGARSPDTTDNSVLPTLCYRLFLTLE